MPTQKGEVKGWVQKDELTDRPAKKCEALPPTSGYFANRARIKVVARKPGSYDSFTDLYLCRKPRHLVF